MFEGAFSFRGRVGRIRYLLGQLVLAPVALVIALIAIVMIATAQRTTASLVFFGLLGLIVAIAFLWYSLSLQVRRIRDIGWSPAVVLGGFFFLMVADALVARHAPALAIGKSGTLFGTLLNLGLTAALYLWPGNGDIDTPAFDAIASTFDAPAFDDRPVAAMAAPSSISSRQAVTVQRKTFGKRGLA